MLARMQNRLRMIGRQIRSSRNARGLQLSPYERPELTWARVIESYDKVPQAYKEFFKAHLSDKQAFPYTVFTPAFQTLGYRITEKLVCTIEDEIIFLEKSGNTFAAQYYPLEEISYVEVSSMLLDSRLKISGMTRQGMLTSSIVRFSSATDYLFTPILKRIRLHKDETKCAVQSTELEQFDQWIVQNFKFMNMARRSILGGEKVVHALLQPEIRMGVFTILGKTYYRTISPTHVCILTDRELIMIREEALQARKDKYGGIWDYIPLNKIAGLSLNRKSGNLLALSIQLLTNERFECLFQASMENEVGQLVIQFTARR